MVAKKDGLGYNVKGYTTMSGPMRKFNLRGVRKYAEQKGVSVAMLTESEKKRFIEE